MSPETVALGIFAINEAVDSGDVGRTLSALRSPDVGLYGVIPECGETYQSDLAEVKKKRLAAGGSWGGTVHMSMSWALEHMKTQM